MLVHVVITTTTTITATTTTAIRKARTSKSSKKSVNHGKATIFNLHHSYTIYQNVPLNVNKKKSSSCAFDLPKEGSTLDILISLEYYYSS